MTGKKKLLLFGVRMSTHDIKVFRPLHLVQGEMGSLCRPLRVTSLSCPTLEKDYPEVVPNPDRSITTKPCSPIVRESPYIIDKYNCSHYG